MAFRNAKDAKLQNAFIYMVVYMFFTLFIYTVYCFFVYLYIYTQKVSVKIDDKENHNEQARWHKKTHKQ